ncbi:SRPBCC family protein [Rhizobium leguminosarum]|uniref:SRPBCC family protein n=1 Tax=Rhizobium leguminosarum TaxID=384 RepID=UPI001C969471|nr:SRPBCC family protein [Rhizobium leguminosarum]MBY5537716.1 SRPBCC family protein [Rhizobium leguminosarum]
MAKAEASVDLPIAADKIWNLIGGFGTLPDWLPYIPKSELSEGGRVRTLANPDGLAIIERLMAYDQNGRSYSYAILQAPFPVKNYLSTLKVKETDGGKASRVEWSGEFTPTSGTDAEASALFRGIYEDGLKALKKKISS